ncbi:AfsR/SARP family transcriptional regulator [Plantactinospora soyae]|uniref:DNA-binding SARP family transcriptional activator/Tfp pilus assembly protein PilF n=1 Tax=Plantactinospora soyae TaxID=1544732 RepID=A0A927M5G7_9ACTN|nr:tetratricopeptide repeat protein [Plantactinospora soyae]MBE1488377.1 DNA-binding SARP family transcriptional activator/Tfp pilus assembly protein PilF [Plantactinospora soyae]
MTVAREDLSGAPSGAVGGDGGDAVRVEILGSVRAWRGERLIAFSSPGQRTVLGLLALAAGRPMTRAEIIDTLWDDSRSPPTATNIIQTHVKNLRRLLEPGRPTHTRSAVLPRIGDGYAMAVPAQNLDLLLFRQLAGTAAEAQRRGDPSSAARLWQRALALWRGAPLVDVPLLARHPKVIALLEERRAAVTRYGEVMIAIGRAADVLPALEEAAGQSPLDETAQGLLIRAYHAMGRRDRAVSAFREVRRRLVEELGVEPGPELTGAYRAALRTRDQGTPAPAQPAGRPQAEPVRKSGPAQLPADVSGFIGRSAEVSMLDRLLLRPPEEGSAEPSAVPTVVLSGTAGVGKTALALRWGHRARHRFPDGQLYVNLRGYDIAQPMPPREALAGFVRALGVPGSEVPFDLDECAARYRSQLDGRRMLIVLDNAASVEQVRPLLPGSASCAVLVTSRDTLAGLVARDGADRIGLDLLSTADSVELLWRTLGERVARESEAAAALAGRCARLPLALRVAAELILTRPSAPLAVLVRELADEQGRLHLLDAGGDPRTGVRAVLSWSYRQLAPATARAFRMLGLHPGPDIDRYAAAAFLGTEPEPARQLLDTLARAHLVQPEGDQRYAFHDLLRAYAAERSAADESPAEADAALDRLFDYELFAVAAAMDMLYPAERHRRPQVGTPSVTPAPITDPQAAREWLDAERATLVATAVRAAERGRPSHAIRMTLTMLRYLESGGYFAEAERMHEHALDAARNTGDRITEAHLLTGLAVMCAQQGRYAPAIERLRRAVLLCREYGDSAGEARALGNLGHVHQRQGRYAEAAVALRDALLLCRRVGDRAGETRAAGNLGHVLLRQGGYREAAVHLRSSAILCQRIGDTTGEAYALASLGELHVRVGRLPRAASRYQRSLALFEAVGDRAGEAHALDGLGRVRLRQDDHAAALIAIEQALTLLRRVGERAGEASSTNSLGELLYRLGQPVRARSEHSTALTLASEIGDPYEQARAHAGLARAYRATGDLEGAATHCNSANALYLMLGVPEATECREELAILDRQA